MKALAKENYSRNMWKIMEKFDMPMTDPRFMALTEEHIEFILYNMEEDAREKRRAQKGLTGDGDYFDSSFEESVWNAKPGEWDTVVEGDDPNELARQVEAMTKEEDSKNLAKKREMAGAYTEHREAGGESQREAEVSGYIQRQLETARERARAAENGEDLRITQNNASGSPEFKPISNKDVQDALGKWEDDDWDDEFEDL